MRLPADVVRPFEVFVNGVEQREGRDYRIEGVDFSGWSLLTWNDQAHL